MIVGTLAAAALAALAVPAAAVECRLALALAIDVSSSVDAAEDTLQRAGLAAALIAPEVQIAFFAAPLPVALAVYEWSGRYNQALLIDWQLIDSRKALTDVAVTIGRSTRSPEFPFAGVTVNGLVVNAADYEAEVTLVEFYRSEVLHGPGAFLEIAQGFEDYERAMRRKLERELSAQAIGAAPVGPAPVPG